MELLNRNSFDLIVTQIYSDSNSIFTNPFYVASAMYMTFFASQSPNGFIERSRTRHRWPHQPWAQEREHQALLEQHKASSVHCHRGIGKTQGLLDLSLGSAWKCLESWNAGMGGWMNNKSTTQYKSFAFLRRSRTRKWPSCRRTPGSYSGTCPWTIGAIRPMGHLDPIELNFRILTWSLAECCPEETCSSCAL